MPLTFEYDVEQLCGGEARPKVHERVQFDVRRDRLLKERPPTRSAEGRYLTREAGGRMGAASALRNIRWAAEQARSTPRPQ